MGNLEYLKSNISWINNYELKSAMRCSFDQNCNQFGLIYQLIWLQNENEYVKRMKPVIKHK